jgi:protein arginine kinase activator
MLCDNCKKNEANVHITRISNGVKQEMNLCEKCAKEMGGFGISGEVDFSSPFTFQNILGGIIDYINQPSESEIAYEPVCKNCGMTYSEFRNTGLLGCSECYKNFSSTLMPVVKRVQGNVEHVGKIPQKLGKGLIEKKKLIDLKEQLQAAILKEEYEKAAELRDKIKEIQKGNKE